MKKIISHTDEINEKLKALAASPVPPKHEQVEKQEGDETTKLTARSIVRFAIVRYKGELFVLENGGRNKAQLIYDDNKGRRCGKEIERDTMLEVVKYPAQLAFEYLTRINGKQ